MELVQIQRTESGFFLDPSAYLAKLPELLGTLPPGAARFAADPQHYDFQAEHCVKDLKLVDVQVRNDSGLVVELTFAWRYNTGPVLRILYDAVAEFTISSAERTAGEQQFQSLADVQLDEILPHPLGCIHEIQFILGSVTVACSDIEARWLA